MHFLPYPVVTVRTGLAEWHEHCVRKWSSAIWRGELNFCSTFQGIESPEACKWKTWNSTLSNGVRHQVSHYNYNSRIYCSEWTCSDCNKKLFYRRITAVNRHTNRYDITKDPVTYKSIVRNFPGLSRSSVYSHNFGRQRKTSCYFEIRKEAKYSSMERQRVEISLSRLAETCSIVWEFARTTDVWDSLK